MYTVLIKDNSIGEVRQHEEPSESWDDLQEFMWSEGNYACDCNREIFFRRVVNESFYDCELECGDTRFSIDSIILEDGTVLNIDFD